MTQATEDGLLDTDSSTSGLLWPGDAGVLPEPSRRVLLQLIRGPYLSAARHPQLWRVLLFDEPAIRSRLNELFLDLVVDRTSEVAFVRNVEIADLDLPRTVRTASLTFLDTAMLLLLRQQMLAGDGAERVIVGQDEVYEQLQVYRTAGRSDESDFTKRLNASWGNLKRYGIISDTTTEGRVEISPVLRLVFGPDQIQALREEYRRIAQSGGGDAEVLVDEEGTVDVGDPDADDPNALSREGGQS